MRWIFHAKHGKARDVVGFSMFMNGLGAVFGKVRMYLLSFHCCSILSTGCVCVKKVKALFSAHFGVNRILDGAINSSNLQSLTIDH